MLSLSRIAQYGVYVLCQSYEVYQTYFEWFSSPEDVAAQAVAENVFHNPKLEKRFIADEIGETFVN